MYDLRVIAQSRFASKLRNVYLPASADRFRRFTIVTHAGGTIADNIIVFIIAAGNPTGKLRKRTCHYAFKAISGNPS